MVSAARARPYVATPLGAQRARPSLQLSESEIVALVGCHANHVVRRQHHCQRCKRGQLLPRMLCGSTTAFRFGGLPCESRGSQVVPPDAVNLCAAQACPLRASFDAQAAQPSTQLIVVRGRMNRSLLFYIELGRLFNRNPFILVRRSIPLACRVLSSDAQQHSATAQA